MISDSELSNINELSFGIYTVFSYLDNKFYGAVQSSNNLGFSINTPQGKISSLKAGADYKYAVSLANMNTIKGNN